MFDWYAIILLLILAIGIAIVAYTYDCKAIVVGGALLLSNDTEKSAGSNTLIIADNAKIVLDGHNLVHDLMHKKKLSFTDALDALSNLMSDIPSKEIHLVIKNPTDKILKDLDMKKPKDYIKSIKDLSHKYANITYHIAYNTKENVGDHHTKGRDDFLTIYLSNDGYIVSKDKYRDFSKFKDIKPFTHYTIKNNKQIAKQRIDPNKYINSLGVSKPTLGTHLYYKFVDKKEHSLLAGKIIVDKEGDNSVFYLAL